MPAMPPRFFGAAFAPPLAWRITRPTIFPIAMSFSS
jgi:hypothetical protein